VSGFIEVLGDWTTSSNPPRPPGNKFSKQKKKKKKLRLSPKAPEARVRRTKQDGTSEPEAYSSWYRENFEAQKARKDRSYQGQEEGWRDSSKVLAHPTPRLISG
jgi:hypothetical protein